MATVTSAPQLAIPSGPTEAADVGEPLFEQRERISVSKYHRMIEAGIFDADSRVELIEGVIVAKMGKNEPHVTCSDLIDALLQRSIPVGYFVSMGNPVTIAERDSEPEPDAQIVRGAIRDFRGRRRTQRDAAMVVEISDSTYRMDRYRKWKTYAGAGVPIYWIVNLNENRLECYSNPVGTGAEARYDTTVLLGPDADVPLILDGQEVARFPVRDLLP